MDNNVMYSKDSLEATYMIKQTVREMNSVIGALQVLGIPAGERLQDIAETIYQLSDECSNHLMQEQHEQLQATQDQTWNLVGAVFTDAVNKMK